MINIFKKSGMIYDGYRKKIFLMKYFMMRFFTQNICNFFLLINLNINIEFFCKKSRSLIKKILI